MASNDHWYVNYWYGSEHLDQDTWGRPELQVGQGVILGTPAYPHAPRWRVVDIWHSYDKHGHFDIGVHVFLEPVSDTEDDYPQRLAPHYFITDGDDRPV